MLGAGRSTLCSLGNTNLARPSEFLGPGLCRMLSAPEFNFTELIGLLTAEVVMTLPCWSTISSSLFFAR